jgi:hypothetical protein
MELEDHPLPRAGHGAEMQPGLFLVSSPLREDYLSHLSWVPALALAQSSSSFGGLPATRTEPTLI